MGLLKLKYLIVSSVFLIFLISACSEIQTKKSQEGVEKFAEKFARAWEQKDYSSMYDMFVPELQAIKNKAEFVETLEYEEKESSTACGQGPRHPTWKKKIIGQKEGQESAAEGGQKSEHTLHAGTNRGGHPAAADQRTC